ncbi:related to lovastatin nonaketide synthase [Rhynchosporium agropyri]|uniref:Related to lovastatin nonaketide synthase n=1 Tax=Rhynchosporium agropyri TaxID=914238 RepID=A0A1E1LPT8_9HELO|nr:related to lovastatin nonaketide synthase [Rhynchosporium agropyri]
MATPTPIAIIGMSFRGPGDAHDIEAFWEMIHDGRSAWSKVPAERWNADAFYHPDVDAVESSNTTSGYFVKEDMAGFDAGFFNIQASEAKAMDPQQRTLLELAWEAFENTGMDINALKGSDTGVYMAQFTKDYENNIFKDTRNVPSYSMTGNGTAITANRISYVFDLKGPSFVLDTGCSGSMVALHQACNSLRSKESGMAIVGGTNLILSPDIFQPMSMNRVLNKDGKCYAFDHRGSGYGRGEGVGCVVLKRLNDALRDGDVVRSVILNTGSNQDGKTNGISLPNQFAQEDLIKATYAAIGLDTEDTGYVEAHGTGTQAGDKIEIAAIANSFTKDKDRHQQLVVGSVKTNIGHLESASGIAGLIKTVLAMERGVIPQHLNFENEKKGLNLAERNIKLPLSLIPFPETEEGIRRASVNSFGYGGTNAHAILELPRALSSEKCGPTNGHLNGTNRHLNGTNGHTNGNVTESSSQHQENVHGTGPSSEDRLYVLSARSQKSVSGLVENTKRWVEAHPENSKLGALSYTLMNRRSNFPWRTSIVASTAAELVAKLGKSVLATREASRIRVAMVFSGQGAQWYAMGRELISTQSKFRESILKSEELLNDLGAKWQLTKVLFQDEKESIIDRSDVSQPACTALQIALVDILESLDVKPQAVVGHSSGEMAAAYAAGALTHKSAITAAYHRGFTTNAVKNILKAKGAMLAVGLGEAAVLPLLAQVTSGKAVVACVNSPQSVTISGDSQAIEELQLVLENQKESVFNRKLKVDTAYHSHHMAVVAEEYLSSMAGLETCNSNPDVKFFSSVTGKLKSEDFGPQYWVDNLLGQVKFSESLGNLLSMQKDASSAPTHHLIIEVGPHAALSGPINQTITSRNFEGFKHSYSTVLLRKKNAVSTMLELVGKLFEAGYNVNLNTAAHISSKPSSETVTDLAPYAWDHTTKYWSESRLSKEHRFRQHTNHDTLGLRVVHVSPLEPVWRNELKMAALPWLKDHMVDGIIVFPGTGYICMAIEAMRQIGLDRQVQGTIASYRLREISFLKALVLTEDSSVEIQLTLKPAVNDRGSSKWEDFKVLSRAENGVWSEHCRGSIKTEFETTTDEVEGSRESDTERQTYLDLLENVKAKATRQASSAEAYKLLKSRGNQYGPTFAALTDLYLGDMEGFAKIKVPDVAAVMPSQWLSSDKIHAATFDSVCHLHLYLLFESTGIKGVMPTTISEVYLSNELVTAAGDELITLGSVRVDGARTANCDSYVYQGDKMLLSMLKAELKAVGESQAANAPEQSNQQGCHEFVWEADVDFISKETIAGLSQVCQSTLSQDDKVRLLETIACHYVQDCLSQLEEANFTPTQKHHVALLDWMKRYQTSDDYAKLSLGPSLDNCLEKLRDSGVEIELLTAVGPFLAQVVQGQREAIELMMEGDVLYRFYAENMWCKPGNEHIAAYLHAASFKNPQMKVLEVGAGTGGATISSLAAVTREHGVAIKHFTFTDISSGFFSRVQPMLEQWSDLVDYKVLDIEKDPVKQGFEVGTYDIVMASNVLHATSDITTTLKNVRKLLKPEGRIVLMELTKVTAWINCIFGSTSGWWAGAHEGRVDSPLLTVEKWAAVMKTTGFGDLELATDILGYQSSVIVATARPSEITANGKVSRPLRIVTAPSASTKSQYHHFSQELLAAFRNAGYTPEIGDLPFKTDPLVKYVVLEDGAEPFLVNPTEDVFRKIATLLTTADVLWVSGQVETEFVKNPTKGIFTGFQRVARAEIGSKTVQYLDVQETISHGCEQLIGAIVSMVLASENDTPQIARGIEPEYIYRDGQLQIPRLLPLSTFNDFAANSKEHVEDSLFQQTQRPVKLQVDTPGLLDSMVFVEDTIPSQPLGNEDIEVETRAFGVNFKDVYVALGQMKATDSMVGEFSGVVTRVGALCQSTFTVGDRVFGWGTSPFASCIRVHVSRVAQLPNKLSFAEGASLSIVFMTAYYALIEKGNLQKGQSVLIHAASGGVGQAAIQIAKSVGAEIFVTVGSASKRELVKEVYGIAETHIFSSKLRTFKAGIQRLTAGRGVDVVLNSLSGEVLLDSWACVANLGTFVEIGKSDIYQNTQLGMLPFSKSVTLVAFDLGFITTNRPAITENTLRQVAILLSQDVLKPVYPIIAMPLTSIEDAFRLIQARKHTGKVVLEAGPDTTVPTRITSPPSSFQPDSTFVIAGGLGDIGREMCRFLASHGAKHVVTLSRRAADSDTLRAIREELSQFDTEFHALQCDVTEKAQVEAAASYCSSLSPVKAVIQAAMVLNDMSLENMDIQNYHIALKPKVLGTQYLAEAFDKAESFILLSSVSGIIGNRGQANYAAGSAFQDNFARSSNGKTHVVSLNLPLVFGSTALNEERRAHMARQGVIPMTLEELCLLLDYAMSADCREKGIKQFIAGVDGTAVKNAIAAMESANPMFCHVTTTAKSSVIIPEDVNRSNAHLGITADLGPEEIHKRLCIAIASRISALAAIDYEEVALDVPILDFGLDSLVAIELKNWLTRTFSTTTIETSEMFGMPSIDALADMVTQRSHLGAATTIAKKDEDVVVSVEEMEEVNDHNYVCCKRTKKLRKLPLLDLKTLFEYHLANHRAIWTEEEYVNTCKAAIEFQQPGGIGQKLYARLAERCSSEENWLTEITTRTIYLDRRYSLVKSNVGGSHRIIDTDLPHTQTERAAVIALAAFKFKLEYETGNMEPIVFQGNPLCMRGHEWLFHAAREPRHGSDETRKFPSNNTIVVLHRGNVFKVDMIKNGELPTHEQLKATFQAVLDTPKEDSAITMVTSMERDEWADVYQRMKLDPINKASIETVERSAFVIALEDTRPSTPRERMDSFLFGDGSNRWYDKSISFTICANGVSGFLNEHSQIDGATLALLTDPIIEAVRKHVPDALDAPLAMPLDFETCDFTLSPFLIPVLSRARQAFLDTVSNIDFELATIPILGASFLTDQQLSAAHSWEIITQIASRLFFGRQLASWTAVLMDMYHLGRPDVVQVCTPVVVSFIDAAIKDIPAGEEEATKKELKNLFQKSVKDLNSAVQKGQLGHVHDRTFTAMEWVLRPDEEAPTLFKSDPGYYNSRPRHIMAGINLGPRAFGEVGFVLMDPKSVWMSYAIGDEGAEYSIVNAGGNARHFGDCIAQAAKIVHNFLT